MPRHCTLRSSLHEPWTSKQAVNFQWVADFAAQADERALVRQLTDQCLRLESALKLADTEAIVAWLEKQSFQTALEESSRQLAALASKSNSNSPPSAKVSLLMLPELDAKQSRLRQSSIDRGMLLQNGFLDPEDETTASWQQLQQTIASLEAETARWRDITHVSHHQIHTAQRRYSYWSTRAYLRGW